MRQLDQLTLRGKETINQWDSGTVQSWQDEPLWFFALFNRQLTEKKKPP